MRWYELHVQKHQCTSLCLCLCALLSQQGAVTNGTAFSQTQSERSTCVAKKWKNEELKKSLNLAHFHRSAFLASRGALEELRQMADLWSGQQRKYPNTLNLSWISSGLIDLNWQVLVKAVRQHSAVRMEIPLVSMLTVACLDSWSHLVLYRNCVPSP